ncbi:hypothetical protein CYMTET_46860 [Cymbomonas tetramitiformis]|uniref:Protein kinase domain-containing protein n=1 Tax=Cymbomonas tetramitiformis TaxID=36881 RepID=A0AAE0BXC3_9CHLO|nr:hypothetical protein CYMTET_46860 [Cymbomonas tetramitiformis]
MGASRVLRIELLWEHRECPGLNCYGRITSDMGLSKKQVATFVSGNMRGTIPWMAPELFIGTHADCSLEPGDDNRVNEKVDVFSFGVVLWEVWTLGDVPYQGLSMSKIFNGVMNNMRPGVPEGCIKPWRELMQRCWSQRVPDRPSFSEIACELNNIKTDLLKAQPC